MSNRLKLIGRLIFWPLFLWSVLMIGQNPAVFRYRVIDWWRLRSYDVPSTISTIAQEANLTEYATRVLYASEPEFDDKQSFNSHCPFPEQSFVLGCYDGNKIFVLDIQAPELRSSEPVTAAHEMLHGAWARMTSAEQKKIRQLLEREFAINPDEHLKQIIAQYRAAGNNDDVIANELHSIIPTEVKTISPELETYYRKYFKDRGAVVALFKSYEEIFAANEAELKSMEKQAAKLLASIQAQEKVLEAKKELIDANNARLSAWSKSSDVYTYNNLVSQQRALVNEYNTLVARYNADLDHYQTIVNRYQSLAFYHNELVNSINSKAETIK